MEIVMKDNKIGEERKYEITSQCKDLCEKNITAMLLNSDCWFLNYLLSWRDILNMSKDLRSYKNLVVLLSKITKSEIYFSYENIGLITSTLHCVNTYIVSTPLAV